MFTELDDAKDGLRIFATCGACETFLVSGRFLVPAVARNVPKLICLGGSVGFGFSSLGGVSRYAGVVANEELSEISLGRYPGILERCCNASSAASLSDIAEEFFRAVLNVNLDLGANDAFVSSSFSFRAFIA